MKEHQSTTETDGTEIESNSGSLNMFRRETLAMLGIGGLGLAAGTATAQSDDGEEADQPFYNWREDVDAGDHALQSLGALEMSASSTPIQDFTGDNLSVENGVLNAAGAPDPQLSPRAIDETETFDNEPYLERLADDTLLVVYRRAPTEGGGHVHRDGYIVARRSDDFGETWDDPVTVADVDGYDTRNQSVIYDEESDRVTVFYRVWDPQTGDQLGEFYKTSMDHGQTWSEAQEVPLEYIDGGAPFGGYVETSNGLLTTWYTSDLVEALFSTDGGQTWGNNVLVGDTTDESGRTLTEPVPARFTEDKIWIWGRDNTTADFFAIKGEDGGTEWGDPVYFNPTGSTSPTPIWVKRTSANEITAVWADRSTRYVHAAHMSAQLAWQRPELLGEKNHYRIHEQLGTNDYGYPTFVQLDGDRRNVLVSFYDDMPDTDIWMMSLGGDGPRAETGGDGTPVEIEDATVQFGRFDGATIDAASDDGWDTMEIERFRIEFDTAFDSSPMVNATVSNAATGLKAYVSNQEPDGFTLQVMNYRTTSRPIAVDWMAIGE